MDSDPSTRAPGAASLADRAARLRRGRATARREVRAAIVSVAGLLGAPVSNQAGQRVGRVVDLVARLHTGERYPPITGVLVRVGLRVSYLGASSIASIRHRRLTLRTAQLDLRDFERRPGEVVLARDVLDHQLIDVDGRQVLRAADLYCAPIGPDIRLVGVDVSLGTLLRRLGPRGLRGRPTPDRVIDWDAVTPFGDDVTGAPASVRLRNSDRDLRRMRPADLADLLEDLDRVERQSLLDRLDPETAADALEEMEPDELEALLREADPERAATLIASMEPDEAVDALRDLQGVERDELLARIPEPARTNLTNLLSYPERQAGGFMTTVLAAATLSDTIGDVRARLEGFGDNRADIDAVMVLDDDGSLVADLTLWELLTHAPDETLAALLADEQHQLEPVTVEATATVDEVAAQLIRTRRPSVLVVDGDDRPLGRILADDVVDALLPERGRFRFPRLLQ